MYNKFSYNLETEDSLTQTLLSSFQMTTILSQGPFIPLLSAPFHISFYSRLLKEQPSVF